MIQSFLLLVLLLQSPFTLNLFFSATISGTTRQQQQRCSQHKHSANSAFSVNVCSVVQAKFGNTFSYMYPCAPVLRVLHLSVLVGLSYTSKLADNRSCLQCERDKITFALCLGLPACIASAPSLCMRLGRITSASTPCICIRTLYVRVCMRLSV